MFGTLATTVPLYNISTLCNKNKKQLHIYFGKLKEPHAKVPRAAVWTLLL